MERVEIKNVESEKVYFIPPIPKREIKVGIYCRVSTNSTERLQSLTSQVSHLTMLIATRPQWLLADVYMDIATSRTGLSRKEFNRMIEDCQSHKLDTILTKSISRFGRDTVEILGVLNQLKQLGVRAIFEQEELDTAKTDSDLMISIIKSLAQVENESRSDNIKMEIEYRAVAGISKMYEMKKRQRTLSLFLICILEGRAFWELTKNLKSGKYHRLQ